MRFLTAIFCIGLCACANTVHLPNGCVVDALSHKYSVSAKAQLAGKTAFNEVLLVSFTDAKSGHALSVFSEGINLWGYDYLRSSWVVWKNYTVPPSANQVAWHTYPAYRVKQAQWL